MPERQNETINESSDVNEYSEEGEVILDEETQGLYDELDKMGGGITAAIMSVLNKADELKPSERKALIRKLRDDLKTVLEELREAGEEQS